MWILTTDIGATVPTTYILRAGDFSTHKAFELFIGSIVRQLYSSNGSQGSTRLEEASPSLMKQNVMDGSGLCISFPHKSGSTLKHEL